MSFGRNLQASIQQQKTERANVEKDETGFPKPDRKEQKDSIATMLGLMGSIAIESIMADLKRMIEKSMHKEIDGYVLALSRIMRHDLAWQCIVQSFSESNEPIPSQYYSEFGANKLNLPTKRPKMTVK